MSIRSKLLLYMTVNSILFAALLFGSNTFFAEKFYIHNKKNTLIENSQQLTKLIADKNIKTDFNDEDLLYQINSLEKNIGCTIFIGTLEGELYYPLQSGHGAPPRPGFMSNPNLGLEKKPISPEMRSFNFLDFPKNSIKNQQQYNKTSIFFITEDPNYKINTLRFQKQLDNGLMLLMWVPMTSISEGASISNNFTAIIALLTIIITGIWTILISKKFTQPITQMNKITKKMSNLDFSENLKINGVDELAQLSRSINQLSCTLDHAINELSSRNKQLEQDINRERSLDKMRREFISNVSHELKTPIFLIQGYAEGLKTNVAVNEERRAFYCDVIMEETEKMDGLIKDLLGLSVIESGMFTIDKTLFNLSSLIKALIIKYQPILKEKKIYIEHHLEEETMLHADPIRIEQVIINLMNNAIDYVDENKIIKINLAVMNNIIKVSVYNSGHSIPEDSLDKIWTSFYKVDKARTRSLGGTGLGLSIVRAILDAHQSTYGATNLNEGVEFWFKIQYG